MPFALNFSDLQDYAPNNAYDFNLDLFSLSGDWDTAVDSVPLDQAATEGTDAPLAGPSESYVLNDTSPLSLDVLSNTVGLTEEQCGLEDMRGEGCDISGRSYRTPEASVADFFDSWPSPLRPIPSSQDTSDPITQDNHQLIPKEFEGYEEPSAEALVNSFISSLAELINTNDTVSSGRGSGVESPSLPPIPSMGQAGPSRWSREQWDESIQQSTDWSHGIDHDTARASHSGLYSQYSHSSFPPDATPSPHQRCSERMGAPTQMTYEGDTAPIHSVHGNKMPSFRSTLTGSSSGTSQYQGMNYNHAQPWFGPGEGFNTHQSMSFSSAREVKEINNIRSISDGCNDVRSRLTLEPVEQTNIDGQTNDGGRGAGPVLEHGQENGRDSSAPRPRKRHQEELESESEDTRGSKSKKARLSESQDTIRGPGITEVEGKRGKPRNLNPRAPALMKSYVHDMMPLTEPGAKEGGFVPLVTAERTVASEAFDRHQMPVSMDNLVVETGSPAISKRKRPRGGKKSKAS
ncbi:hypothetical protein JR316_0008638 [Psilocybe cubensis]|uniref:Uncharacterized protein n=2 Tax=Psilocybe cubensis TaxID=181762 RepID=A0ACB8GRT3_PSICU|nr:hypothetical protein JR316_0008638 [Psilocybe cubensis]KAH9478185.1 hypothetical protein JR316_0008638 [Psilocybe cubensis]